MIKTFSIKNDEGSHDKEEEQTADLSQKVQNRPESERAQQEGAEGGEKSRKLQVQTGQEGPRRAQLPVQGKAKVWAWYGLRHRVWVWL